MSTAIPRLPQQEVPGLAARHPTTRVDAPDLDPTEAVWSQLKRSIGNLVAHAVEHRQAIVKNRLKSIQYRTDLLDGFLTHTGPDLDST